MKIARDDDRILLTSGNPAVTVSWHYTGLHWYLCYKLADVRVVDCSKRMIDLGHVRDSGWHPLFRWPWSLQGTPREPVLITLEKN